MSKKNHDLNRNLNSKNIDNSKKIKNIYNKGDADTIEFEISLLNVDKYLYNLFYYNTKPDEVESEITIEYKFPNVKYVIYPDNKITEKSKENLYIKFLDIIYISIQKEKEEPSNLTIKDIQELENLETLRYRKKNSFFIEGYDNWRFDLSVNKIIDDEKILKINSNINKVFDKYKKEKYHVEAEYIGKTYPTSEEIKEVYLLFKKYKILYNLQKTLNKSIYTTDLRSFANRPVDLTLKTLPKIQNGYSVSEKADGERCFLYYDSMNNIYSIFQPFDIKQIFQHDIDINKFTLVDAEFVDNKYYIFDLLIDNGKNMTDKNLFVRYKTLENKNLTNENILLKNIWNLNGKEDIYKLSKEVYTKEHPYEIDGLIYTPLYQGYYSKNIYKWKPIEKQTIDFLVRKKSPGKYYLFVSCKKSDLNSIKVDDKYSKLFPFIDINSTNDYFPYYFEPSPVIESKKPLKDNTIIEFLYDKTWKPYRERLDKTKGYLENFNSDIYSVKNGPNSCRTANNIWELIQNPVTEDIIFGKEKYYDPSRNIININLYRYNNYVKTQLYSEYVKDGDLVMEIAGGRGGDLLKLTKSGAKYVLHFDIDKLALIEAERRYSTIKNKKPEINFVQFNPVTENIKKVKDIVDKRAYETFDVISCQFAFHYFLENSTTVETIIDFVNFFLKEKGIFMFTAYDGKEVFNQLKVDKLESNVDKLEFKVDEKVFARIEKKYNDKTFKNHGQEINVWVDKIGIEHKEYLINEKYVIEQFEKHDINLIESGNFIDFINGFKLPLTEDEKEYIKLHKYYIFEKSLL